MHWISRLYHEPRFETKGNQWTSDREKYVRWVLTNFQTVTRHRDWIWCRVLAIELDFSELASMWTWTVTYVES